MLKDQDFTTVIKITAGYALVALLLLAMQPTGGRTETAQAGGNFEVPTAGFGGYFYQLASAE
jgi:hypothetical protein